MVYQAYCKEIADFALAHQTFGGTGYSFKRMSWIKTNFLWMMYRSGWGTKPGQERVLAIEIPSDFLPRLVKESQSKRSISKTPKMRKPDILVQLDPDSDLSFHPLQRRAIQIGLRSDALRQFISSIKKITDLTPVIEKNRVLIAVNKFAIQE